MAVLASQVEEETRRSVNSLELSHLAKFAFNLCQKSNSFYHKYPVLAEDDMRLKTLRLLILDIVRESLATALTLMGIPLPERM